MTDTDERFTRVETTLDVLADQWEKRFTSLEAAVTRLETKMMWLWGLQMTILVAAVLVLVQR